jgi:hypothetical protein
MRKGQVSNIPFIPEQSTFLLFSFPLFPLFTCSCLHLVTNGTTPLSSGPFFLVY